jgi:microcystin-dependent protein
MALETGTYINSLNASNPVSTDGLSQADDHLRLIKSTIKSTFPNIDGAITTTEDELNVLDGATATTADLNKLAAVTSSAAELNVLDGATATTADLNKLAAVTATASELNLMDGVTASTAELNYVDGVTSAIQTQLDAKQSTITGAATTVASSNLAASRAVVSDVNGKISTSAVTSTELGYLDGVTSSVQTQLGTKAPLASPALTGTPTAPTAGSGTNNTQVATTGFVRSIIPAGVILLWSGSEASIPTGWLLCDGANGTPDLRNRFVVGAGSTYAVGATGGADSVTLTTSQIPSHNHTATSTSTVTDPGHSHTYKGQTGSGGSGVSSRDAENTTLTTNSATTGISVSTSTSIGNTGGGSSHENRPPYYALCYIMKT